MSKAKPRPPALSNLLTVKAGPTAMQKVLKQNLHKIVIYVKKPRPAAKVYSQSTANEGCKNFLFNIFKFNNQHNIYVYVSTNSNARNMYHKNTVFTLFPQRLSTAALVFDSVYSLLDSD